MWTATGPHYTISPRMRAPTRPARSIQVVRAVSAVFIAAAALAASSLAQGTRTSVSLIVAGGTVLTQNAAHNVVSPGAVAVNGANIVDVGPAAEIAARYTAADTIDASGQVVLPGLINTHTHAPMVMFRGLADDLALMD